MFFKDRPIIYSYGNLSMGFRHPVPHKAMWGEPVYPVGGSTGEKPQNCNPWSLEGIWQGGLFPASARVRNRSRERRGAHQVHNPWNGNRTGDTLSLVAEACLK